MRSRYLFIIIITYVFISLFCRSGTCLTWTDKIGPVDSWILRKMSTVISFIGVMLSWTLMRIFSSGIWTIHRYCSLCAFKLQCSFTEDFLMYLHLKPQLCILKILILYFCITIFYLFPKKKTELASGNKVCWKFTTQLHFKGILFYHNINITRRFFYNYLFRF